MAASAPDAGASAARAEYRAAGHAPRLREQRRGESSRPRAAPRGASRPDRPPAPWGSFPLVEIVILVALVLLLVGFFMATTRGRDDPGRVSLVSLAAPRADAAGALRRATGSHSGGARGLLAVVVLGLGFVFAWPQLVQGGRRGWPPSRSASTSSGRRSSAAREDSASGEGATEAP